MTEFYGGKELNKKIRAKLEEWWIRLSYVTWPTVGLAEARFSLAVLERLVGATISVRRVIAIAVVLLAYNFYLFYYLDASDSFVEEVLDHPLEFVLHQGILGAQVFISLWVTHRILVVSINRLEGRKYSSLYFLLVLVATISVSALVSEAFMSVPMLLATDFVIADHFPELPMWFSFFAGSVTVYVAIASDMLWYLRLALFALFAASVLAGWGLQWVKATIYRLTESEKGALTVISAFLTGIAASIKLLVKGPI